MSMSQPRGAHAPARLLLGVAAASLVVLTGCSSSSTDTADSSTTTAAPGGTTDSGSTDGTTPGTTTSDGTGTSTVVAEIDNDDIISALEASDPDLLALVDTTYMSWSAFGGFTIPVPTGTDPATAIELCEAVSEVVYEGADNSIVIATEVTAGNIMGTPIVERSGESGTCAAV